MVRILGRPFALLFLPVTGIRLAQVLVVVEQTRKIIKYCQTGECHYRLDNDVDARSGRISLALLLRLLPKWRHRGVGHEIHGFPWAVEELQCHVSSHVHAKHTA